MIDERINEPSFSDMHTHPIFELFFVFDGEVTVKTEQQNYSVGKNQALLIPPSFYHQTFTKPNTKKSNIYFSFTLRKKSSETEDLYSEFERVFSGIPLIKIDNTYDIGVFITMFQKIVTLNDIGKAERMRSVLTGLFFALFDAMAAQSSQIISTQKKQKTGMQYHYEIDRILSTNFMNNISLDFVAKSLFLSTKRTAELIKKIYGKNFRAVMTEMKIQVAKQYLKETDWTIAKIAEVVGYNSTRGFLSSFQQFTGVTPSKYRQNSCEKRPDEY